MQILSWVRPEVLLCLSRASTDYGYLIEFLAVSGGVLVNLGNLPQHMCSLIPECNSKFRSADVGLIKGFGPGVLADTFTNAAQIYVNKGEIN